MGVEFCVHKLPCWKQNQLYDKEEISFQGDIFLLKSTCDNDLTTPMTASANSPRQLFLIDENLSDKNSLSSEHEGESFTKIGNKSYQMKKYQKAINNYMIALHKVQRRDVRMADIHFTIAQCYFSMGNFNTALKHCKLAQAKYAQLTGKNSEAVAMTCNLIGHIQTQINDYILAQHYYEKAYQIHREEEESNYKSLIQVGFNLASLYLSMDKDEQALEVYLQLEHLFLIDKKIAKDSTFIQLYRCIGLNYFKLQFYKRSIQYFQKGFALSNKIFPISKNVMYKLINSYKMIKNSIQKNSSSKLAIEKKRFLKLDSSLF